MEPITLPDVFEFEEESKDSLRQGSAECQVCLRPARGYHCGIICCKACKTFFRRLVVSNVEPVCFFENKCFQSTIQSEIRLRCRGCRYKKCISVSMNPLSLELSDKEKETKNFQKLVTVSKIETVPSIEVIARNILDSLIYLEEKLDKFRLCEYNPPWRELGSLADMIQGDIKLYLADRLKPMPGWPMNLSLEPPKTLPEKSKIREIPDDPNDITPPRNFKIWMFFNLQTNIEYAKTFDFFQTLDLKDQLILVGHATLICMSLQNSYFAVSRKVKGCLMPDGTEQPLKEFINFNVALKSFSESHYSETIMSFAPLMRLDIQYIEYVLLKAICLCNPAIIGLSDHAQAIIGKERQKYANLLLKHCFKTQNNGPARFAELLGIIPLLEKQQRTQKDTHIYLIAPLVAKMGIFSQLIHDIMFSD